MDHAPTFARHFARLVWQLLNESDAYDLQIASLQLLVSASRSGTVTLGVRGQALVTNGSPLGEAGPESADLVAQLIGHSIREVSFDQPSSPADMLLMARILATAPVAGDGGRSVVARLDALDARTVRVMAAPLDAAANGAHATSSIGADVIPDVAVFAPVEPARNGGNGTNGHGADADVGSGIATTARLNEMFGVFSSSQGVDGSAATVFQQLDAAATPKDAARELDGLLKVIAEASARARHDVVADVLYGIVARESALTDDAIRRQYGVALRRIAVPLILRSVTTLLPRRRERHDEYMTVIARCEESGAEALAESLIAAPTIGDRRVFYDALVRLKTGIRTLVHMLGDSRWYVVRNAAELLGELKVGEAEVELMRLLEHDDDRVRSAAANALARIGSAKRGRVSRAAVAVAADAAEGNGNGHAPAQGGLRSVHSLIRALERESDSRVQVALVAALGQLGTAQAVDKLVELARTERGLLARQRPTPLRVAAVHAIGQARSPNAHQALQALLRDKSPAIRGAASWVILGKRDAAAPA
ncbi:MAG TPA: HEAT repeat domain-containing protein [Gemmatimonadaceae bacterium]|nr:HEAT repeat domain-containing protein [Gemmatimonadaceae bacterium]